MLVHTDVSFWLHILSTKVWQCLSSHILALLLIIHPFQPACSSSLLFFETRIIMGAPKLFQLAMAVALIGTSASAAFVSPSTIRRTSSLSMISFGSSSSSSKKSFPKDVKEAVTRCRASVQEALGKRISRMDIEFPVGANFGVEKGGKKQSQKKSSAGVATLPTKDLLDTSDRELARIFVEMFQVRFLTRCYKYCCPFAIS